MKPSKEELIKLQTEVQGSIDMLQVYKALLEVAINFYHLIPDDTPIGSFDNLSEADIRRILGQKQC